MEKVLDVYFYRHLVGRLIQDSQGDTVFEYNEDWLADEQNAIPLSQSLPLKKGRFSRKESRPFFGGILPEQSTREIIAKNLGISPRNDFALLEKIGGECAGAVTFLHQGKQPSEVERKYRELSDRELVEIIKSLHKRPLLAGEKDIRLSLAGAQDKVAVHVSTEGKISIPLDGSPSTHILKPENERFPGLVFNESLCMNLAGVIGLPVAKTEAKVIDSIPYLLIERYDRIVSHNPDSGSPKLERLHQEDFCQAMGISSETKYQNEGGPSLKQCSELVREVSDVPVVDLQNLLDAVIFNFLIGNHDAHGKNFSLLYVQGKAGFQTRLAPFYDLLSTEYYPALSKKMAMKIGGEYSSEKVRLQNFEKLAVEAGFSPPTVRSNVAEVIERVRRDLPGLLAEKGKVAADIGGLIEGNCRVLAR